MKKLKCPRCGSESLSYAKKFDVTKNLKYQEDQQPESGTTVNCLACSHRFVFGAVPEKDEAEATAEPEPLRPHISPGDRFDEEVLRIIADQGKIAAVKFVRDAKGIDLKSAKDYVESLDSNQDSIEAEPFAMTPPDELRQQVLHLLQTSGKLAAIKHFKESTGALLKDSKDYVDALEAEKPADISQLLFTLGTGANTQQGDTTITITGNIPEVGLIENIKERYQKTGILSAIMLYREITGVGLKEAKEQVESMLQVGKPGVKANKGCYLATACYGSSDCEEVILLHIFRDHYLSRNLAGRLFISLYYRISPWLIRHFAKNETQKALVRLFISTFIINNIRLGLQGIRKYGLRSGSGFRTKS